MALQVGFRATLKPVVQWLLVVVVGISSLPLFPMPGMFAGQEKGGGGARL